MKVLLVADFDKDVAYQQGQTGAQKLGWFGDVVEVSEGYARNYLLPQGLVVIPTEANLKSLAKEKAMRSEQRVFERKRLEDVAAAVDGAEVVVAARANEQGHLFGSVGRREIADNLQGQGFATPESLVQLSEPIKQVGTSQLTLQFANDLTAAITVVIVAQQDDVSEPTDQNK